jgi:ABC-type multidrug transport system ATPase subunit/pSer/pThr/pTyr-binding forkhead associated (FHA) protein
MKPTIVIQSPDGSTRNFELERDMYHIGRDPGNEIVLPSDVVSRKHAQLEFGSNVWTYTDVDSRNGSYLNGERIHAIKLQDGMIIQIGQKRQKAVTLKFHIPAGQSSVQSHMPIQTIIERPTSTTGYIRLEPVVPSEKKIQIIGRNKDADIYLPAPVISRRHASLQAGTPEWTLTDLDSKNGTFLNGRRITHPEQLKLGDVLQIGPFRLTYEGQGKLNRFAASRGLHLDGKGIICIVGKGNDRKTILNDINISCNPQEFIALVGGSGAGKSTLLKALSGLLPIKGQVLVEGDDLFSHSDVYRSMIGYVPQDDILHQDLTVQEALEFSARLRLPPDTTEAEIKDRIDRALGQVELTSQRCQVIHSLSGGQRKRASIAVELLADPPLFFLDEPTSGLDPGLEKKVMLILRKLAESGKTIILVTHATANITECHQVAFLSQGRLVYYGPPDQACNFFSVEGNDFAEIYSTITDPDSKLAVKKAETWEKRFRQSDFFVEVTKRLQSTTRASRASGKTHSGEGQISLVRSVHQFFLLAKRYFLLIRHDKPLFSILLLVMPLLAILILGISEKNWLKGDLDPGIRQYLIDAMNTGEKSAVYFPAGGGQKLLFIMSLTTVMLGLFASAYEIVKERTIYKRERMVFLQLVPYLASKIFPLGIFAAGQCFVFLLIIKIGVDFPSDGVFLTFFMEAYLTLFLAVLSSISMGLFISSMAQNQNIVTYIILGVLFLQITFAGVIFELPGASKSLSSLTLTRWTMQALGSSADLERLNSLSRTRFQPGAITEEVEGRSVTIDHPKPVEITTEQDFTLDYESSSRHLITNWTMLAGLFLVFSGGTLAVLQWRKLD